MERVAHVARSFLIQIMKFPLVILLFSFIACSQQQARTGLHGQINNLSGDWKQIVYLDFLGSPFDIYGISQKMIIDSAIVHTDGSYFFDLENLPLDKGLYRLRIIKKTDVPATLYGNFFESNCVLIQLDSLHHFTVSSDTGYVSDKSKISGPDYTVELGRLVKILSDEESFLGSAPIAKVRDSMMQASNINFRLLYAIQYDSLMNIYYSDLTGRLKEFINNTNNSLLPPLIATNLFYHARRYSDIGLNDYIDSLTRQLSKNTDPVNQYYLKGLLKAIEESQYLTPGTPMPEFILPSIQGDTFKLSALKGRLILIDFWASWCSPCIIENKEIIKPLYDQYKNQGLTIVGISLDHRKDKWMKATTENNFNWLQLSDLKGHHSDYVNACRIQSIPSTFLLNENKTVLAKNLRGAQLTTFIKNYLDR